MPKTCSAKCGQWSDGGVVPLECEAVCTFDDGCSLRFGNSFLLPFRQRFEIASTSTRSGTSSKVYTCDDFVIPRSRTQASFVMETGATLSDASMTVTATTDVFTANTTDAQQETKMFEEFSRIALELDNKVVDPKAAAICKHDVYYWANIALATQLVIDACMLSMSKGGEEVPVGELRL